MHISRQINENDTGEHSQFCRCFFIYLHQEFLSSKSYFSGFCWLASPRLPADLASVSPKFPPLQTALILSIYSTLEASYCQSTQRFLFFYFMVSISLPGLFNGENFLFPLLEPNSDSNSQEYRISFFYSQEYRPILFITGVIIPSRRRRAPIDCDSH